MNIMYLKNRPVLHLVGEGTDLSAAKFVPDLSRATFWTNILEFLATVYTSLPYKIVVDQGSAFGDLFASLGATSKVDVQRTSIRAIGERYHEPLRSTVPKLRLDHPSVSPSTLLSMVKSMNAMLGLGIVPSALVFGEYLSIKLHSELAGLRASPESRAKVATSGRKHMEKK